MPPGRTLNKAESNEYALAWPELPEPAALRPGVTVKRAADPGPRAAKTLRPDDPAGMLDGVINANFYDSRPIRQYAKSLTDGATIRPFGPPYRNFKLEENPKAGSAAGSPAAVVTWESDQEPNRFPVGYGLIDRCLGGAQSLNPWTQWHLPVPFDAPVLLHESHSS